MLPQFGLAEYNNDMQWVDQLMEEDTLTLHKSLEKYPTKNLQTILVRAITRLAETCIYVIGNPLSLTRNPDAKYEFLRESAESESFFVQFPPSYVIFLLDTDWAQAMVLVAAAQRKDNPYRSLVLADIPPQFFSRITDKLNVLEITFKFSLNIQSELSGWLAKVDSLKNLIFYNQSLEVMSSAVENMPDTVTGIQIHSKRLIDTRKMMTFVTPFIPTSTLQRIKRIGMSTIMLEPSKPRIMSECTELEAIILEYHSDTERIEDAFHRVRKIITKWNTAVIVKTRESNANGIRTRFQGDIFVQIAREKIEYGEASFVVIAKTSVFHPRSLHNDLELY